MLKGLGKLGFRFDTWLPITLTIVDWIVSSSLAISDSIYEAILYKAMYSLGLFALLRIGEITGNSRNSGFFPLQLNQTSKACDCVTKVLAYKIVFLNCKHNYNQRTYSIVI